jgi:hypothetical protein
MQLIVATEAEADTASVTSESDGFSDLIGKPALRRRRRSLKKKVEEAAENLKAIGTGSGHGATSTKGKEESGETVPGGGALHLHLVTGVPQREGGAEVPRSGLPGWR